MHDLDALDFDHSVCTVTALDCECVVDTDEFEVWYTGIPAVVEDVVESALERFGRAPTRENWKFCAIVEHEEYAGLPVDRYYNVKRLIGQPGRYGNYVAPVRGDLFREFKRVVKKPKRLDRISFESLRGKRLIGEIKTVTHDHQHNPLSDEDQYSRIKRLVQVIQGYDW